MRQYRCVQESISLPLSGSVKFVRCELSATHRFRVTWMSGKVNFRRVCDRHAELIRREAGRMIEVQSVKSFTETTI